MFRRCSIALLGTTLLSTPAWAQSPNHGFYVGAAAGQSIFWDVNNVEFDFFGWMLSGLAGYRLSPNLRVEGELLYETADVDNVSSLDIEVFRVLANAYYDLPGFGMIGLNWRPYGGVGAGFANVEFGDDDLELTMHGEGGVGVEISNGVEFVPGIRVSYTTLDGGGDDLWVTQLRAGVRYSF